MKNTSKMSKQRKLIFIFLLILGNAMMALLTFPAEKPPKTAKETAYRPDYINIRIKGVLRAELDPNAPVTLLGERNQKSFQAAFVIKQYKKTRGPESFLKGESFDEFLVSVPKESAQKLLGDDVFAIYPGGLHLSKKQRKSYEVVY